MTYQRKGVGPPCQRCGDEGAELCPDCLRFLCEDCLDNHKHVWRETVHQHQDWAGLRAEIVRAAGPERIEAAQMELKEWLRKEKERL